MRNISVLVSLARLVWTMHKVCKVRGSNPGHHQKRWETYHENHHISWESSWESMKMFVSLFFNLLYKNISMKMFVSLFFNLLYKRTNCIKELDVTQWRECRGHQYHSITSMLRAPYRVVKNKWLRSLISV
jgi:hypothetical protein